MSSTALDLKLPLKRQYHAALAMMRETIERCPDDVWLASDHKNAFWQIAYHALFITHLYLQQDEAAFRPWSQHQGDVQNPDGIAGPPDPNSGLPLIPKPYTKAQALEYWKFCDQLIDDAIDKLDLENPECGFRWYHMSKLEHQLVNLRHVQHHTAQLADRLRSAANIGIDWVGGDENGTA
ncbi:MAG: DinB family protein [Candidatus Acidiferrales bacterium]